MHTFKHCTQPLCCTKHTALEEDGMMTGLGEPTIASSATRLDATVGDAAAPSTLNPTTFVYGCELRLALRKSIDRRSMAVGAGVWDAVEYVD